MIDNIAIKGKWLTVPFTLQNQILEQLHINMGIKKTRLLVMESVYLVNMNTDIENPVKQFTTCLQYQQTQPHEKTIACELLCKPLEVVSADISWLKIKYFCAL